MAIDNMYMDRRIEIKKKYTYFVFKTYCIFGAWRQMESFIWNIFQMPPGNKMFAKNVFLEQEKI